MGKTEGAFLTIGELASELGVPQHVLRYWETRFPRLRPLQRAGNRRYYRAEDVALARRIHHLLNAEGYTVRGVQQLLDGDTAPMVAEPNITTPPSDETPPAAVPKAPPAFAVPVPLDALRAIRALLTDALEEDARIA